MENYVLLHLHSDYSNGTTNIDSVTKPHEYINLAKRLNMPAIAFTEHGNMFGWYSKKKACEDAGVKYIHAVEMYLTQTLEEKIRDNYHICLFAKNKDGFIELNKLVSKAYNKEDGHYYYSPRISLNELKNTSDNIIVSTACIGGGLRKSSKITDEYLKFLTENNHRCFLEIQHHITNEQYSYNIRMKQISKDCNIPLVITTDTHALDERHAEGRTILQKAKGIHFSDEENWDVVFKDYNALKYNFLNAQGSLNEEEFNIAIGNTLKIANMIEPFEIDYSYKYPKLYENSEEVLKQKIFEGIKYRNIHNSTNFAEYKERIGREFEVYKHNNAIDYILLDADLKEKAREKGIFAGCSRGSVSGSIICYLLRITDVDSIKRKLNFERFMNKERVSLPDIDSDYSTNQREEVKDILYNNPKFHCSEIITFNTVKEKGAIRDCGRALGIELSRVNEICKSIDAEEDLSSYKQEFPELFKYKEIVQDTIVSIGFHPAGTIVSPISLEENIGTLTLSTTNKPVSMLNMVEVDAMFYVKMDILGLDNVGLINDTCKLANIERLIPENVDINDEKVWNSIKEDTTLIFQWTSESAQAYIKQLFSTETINKIKEKYKELGVEFSYMDLLSIGNGAIRPGGSSYRENLAKGIFYDNKHEGINKFLAKTLGYVVYQEQIIEFLNKFCGFTLGEADVVRRGIAKKKGVQNLLPDIKKRFIEYITTKDKISLELANEIIESFLQVVLDSSDYLFSLNHSDSYSYIGYMCGYLREYYPIEFITVALNQNKNDLEKTKDIIAYAKKRNIEIKAPIFGKSKAEYFFDKENNTIYKGVESIKFINDSISNDLYILYQKYQPQTFTEVLKYLKNENIKYTSKHMEILIKTRYFRQYGGALKLLKLYKIYQFFTKKKTFKKEDFNGINYDLLSKYSKTQTAKMFKDLDVISMLSEVESMISKDLDYSPIELVRFEIMYSGISSYKNEELKDKCIVISVMTKYPYDLIVYNIGNGEIEKYKVGKKTLEEFPIEEFSAIEKIGVIKKRKRRLINDEWVFIDDYHNYLQYYRLNINED